MSGRDRAPWIIVAIIYLMAVAMSSVGCYRRASPLEKAIDASRRGDSGYVRSMLRKDPTLVRMRFRDGWTLLHRAAYEWDDAITLALIEAGAEVDARASDGTTPLLLAVMGGSGPLSCFYCAMEHHQTWRI